VTRGSTPASPATPTDDGPGDEVASKQLRRNRASTANGNGDATRVAGRGPDDAGSAPHARSASHAGSAPPDGNAARKAGSKPAPAATAGTRKRRRPFVL
jgi:hypothetical protein